jgi:hypothetical protein
MLRPSPAPSPSCLQCFAGHSAVFGRQDGCSCVWILDETGAADSSGGAETVHKIEWPEPIHNVSGGANRVFETSTLRLGYSSLTTPQVGVRLVQSESLLRWPFRCPSPVRTHAKAQGPGPPSPAVAAPQTTGDYPNPNPNPNPQTTVDYPNPNPNPNPQTTFDYDMRADRRSRELLKTKVCGVWCVVWCGVVWCGVVWCGVVCRFCSLMLPRAAWCCSSLLWFRRRRSPAGQLHNTSPRHTSTTPPPQQHRTRT